MLRPMSLRARATFWYAGLLAVALIVASCGVYFGIRSYLKHVLQRELSSTVETIQTDFLSKLAVKGEAWVVGEVRESYEGSANDHFVRITSGGRLLYRSVDLRDPAVALDSIALPRGADGSYFHRQLTNGGWVLVYAAPYVAANGQTFEVEAGASLDEMERTLKWLARILTGACLLTLVAAGFGGYALMRYPLRPLVDLTITAEGIGRKAPGDRLPVIQTGDELERLSRSLNGMIDRLEEALAHTNRFSADASHELRTPLMIMRGELEALLEQDGLPAEASGNLISALEEVDRMARIVGSLMAITRIDAGERMAMERIDLSALVRSTIEQMQLLADEKQLPLTVSGERSVHVDGDAMRIRQVLVNIVDNAIKYTPQPEELGAGDVAEVAIAVSIYTSAADAHVQVVDHGIGITADALPHVFERFYRADYARSRGAGGVGLGLAIVKSIMAAHGGNVSIVSNGGRGTTVRLQFPLAEGFPSHTAGRTTDPAINRQPVPGTTKETPQ